MKKRIACALLTLVMLVSLVNAGALTASAASGSTSEAAITVLKKMLTKQDYCYQLDATQTFLTGYGTVCNESGHKVGKDGKPVEEKKDDKGNVVEVGHKEHYISEKQADQALRDALDAIDKKVDAFASANGLKLSKAQNDALNAFSFLFGTSWTEGTGTLKTLLKSGPSYSNLLDAMKQVNNNNDNRCAVFANMYVNGVYSNNLPTNYRSVKYDPKGGIIAQTTVPGAVYESTYDPSVSTAHLVTPTREGYIFMGWYDKNNTPVTALPRSIGDTVELEAQWQKKATSYKDAAVAVNHTIIPSELSDHHLFTEPTNDEKYYVLGEDGKTALLVESIPAYVENNKLKNLSVDQFFVDGAGQKWFRIKDSKYWIKSSTNVGNSAGGSVTTEGTAVDVAVTVTNAYVNARQSASAASAQVGSYKVGTKLRIIRTTVVNGMTWGQVAKSDTDSTPVAWVCLMYTNWGEVGQNASNTNSTVGIATAVVNYSGYVNVRKGAGTDNQIVGSLKNGQAVSLYEIKTVNGHQWGRSDAGWFCLTYATVTMQNGTTNPSVNVSDQGALSYTFNGKLASAATAYVSTSESVDKTADQPKEGQSVIISNMVSGSDGTLWAKIGWTAVKWIDGGKDQNGNAKDPIKQQYTAYGWVKMGGKSLSGSSTPVAIEPVSYTVVSNLTVRESASSDAKSKFTMNPGTQFQVSEIQLVGEGIWGFTKSDVNTVYAEGGWANLSTRYVKRTTLPNVPANQIVTATGKVATIVNTDTVRVRAAADVTSRQVGSLSRGATANVLEISDDGKWYRLDVDPDKNPETESWVYKDYVSVSDSTASNGSGSSTTVQNPDGTTTTTTTVGTGIVANTYAGLNVRSGAGTNYPLVGGKLLPGTAVEIDQIVTVGTSKWGHCKQGWVCMDYITMISSTVTETTTNNGNGTPVQSLDKVDKTTTTAIYTGKTNEAVDILAEPNRDAKVVESVGAGTRITMHELAAVKEIVDNKVEQGENPNKNQGGTLTTTTETTYWARVNGGYIYNPMAVIDLDPLDEKVHTLTGNDTLNVRKEPNTSSAILGQLKKGDQVKVTALKIDYDKVWGRIDYDETEDAAKNEKQGWIRLDYMSEGAYYVQQSTTNTVTNNYGTGTAQAGIGNTGNTGNVGSGNTGNVGTGNTGNVGSGNTGNTGATGTGYRYTGKVINTNEVNVRQTASTGAKKTTVLKNGASLVIYETTISEGMAWGRCDAGWVYLYYVDLTPVTAGVLDARVVYNDNTVIYSDANGTSTVGTYAKMSVIDIYEIVGKMARTDLGWVHTDNLLQ